MLARICFIFNYDAIFIAPAVEMSIDAADYLKKLTKDLDVDEQ